MSQHIGIVACSAEGAALCYRTICVEGAQLLGAHDHPEVSMHTHSLADYMRCIDRDDWAGVAQLMLASARKAGARRRRLPDLPRQHHPPGAAATSSRARRCPGCTSPRWWRRRRRSAASGASAHRHALARRQRGLSGEARRARPRLRAARSGRARRDQPHHHGRAGVRRVQAGGGRLPAEVIARLKAEGLRRRRARLHRDPADHERRQLAAADARFDAPAGARRAAARRRRPPLTRWPIASRA